MSNTHSEESKIKRCKHNSQKGTIEFQNDSLVLPSIVKSWLSHIGVDIERYSRTLYQIATGKKKRYYRLLSNSNSVNCDKGSQEETSNRDHVKEAGCLNTESVHTLGAIGHSKSAEYREKPTDRSHMTLETPSHTNSECADRPTAFDPVVPWLRDVKLYECYTAIPTNAIGLDAASAAVVDALRLSELTQKQGTKWILDMCCAPGGKLLGTVSALKRIGASSNWRIIGLDTVKRRLDVCASLLKRETAPENIDVHLLNCRAQDFTEFEGESMINRFDRILVDAECTHEGSLRSVLRTLKYWGVDSLEDRFTPEHARTIISNQRELLRHAIKLIRPGGLIIYSTCSLHEEQNELLVASVVEEFDSLMLRQLPLAYCGCCSVDCERRDKWPAISTESLLTQHCSQHHLPVRAAKQQYKCSNTDSPICVRFDPLGPDTDGIFIAAITKM
ncbi:S-adenosyl-L-methionine-dependent methyltransferase superfamily protein [Babesia ovis]|uniref:S-adenosyl-L-methionine-dependent methyltransferase superfamily protein n=1 Tax=Babesia ovis TaxID=5869 RepID=A0A9W5TF07_BABOV|nr:S-adenosyl-L-methionine-dependent methyltransferase superfamily protein [Babesia ovis]